MSPRKTAFGVIATTALLGACSQRPEPVYASSGDQAAYAERYPKKLATLRAREAEYEQQARQNFESFKQYPAELDSPDWTAVGTVVERADESGKSGDYASSMVEVEQVTSFYGEEKDAIHQKVGGLVTYAAKQKQCDVELYGPATASMDKAVEKQLEDRLRAHDGAQRYIEDHQDALGKQNLEKLQHQADGIAYTSYLVHVRLKQLRAELDEMLADSSDVKKTLEKSQEEAKTAGADPKASKNAQATAKLRADTSTQARASLDAEVEQGRKMSEEMEKRIKALENEYEKAMDALTDAIDAKAKEPPKPAKAGP